jgi:hypothetical protein
VISCCCAYLISGLLCLVVVYATCFVVVPISFLLLVVDILLVWLCTSPYTGLRATLRLTAYFLCLIFVYCVLLSLYRYLYHFLLLLISIRLCYQPLCPPCALVVPCYQNLHSIANQIFDYCGSLLLYRYLYHFLLLLISIRLCYQPLWPRCVLVLPCYQNLHSIPNQIFLSRILECDIRHINAFVCVIWINNFILWIWNIWYTCGVGYNLWGN